jgi:hypothetical protein
MRLPWSRIGTRPSGWPHDQSQRAAELGWPVGERSAGQRGAEAPLRRSAARSASCVAACPPVARSVNRPGSLANPDRIGLHRVRGSGREAQGHRRRGQHRWRLHLACCGGRNRIGVAPRPRLRRPWPQRLLAGAPPLRCGHTMVAAVLRRRGLARRPGSRHRDRHGSRISSLAKRQARPVQIPQGAASVFCPLEQHRSEWQFKWNA